MTRFLFALGVALASIVAARPAAAAVSVMSLFSDHMVVQRDMPAPIWGTAAAGEMVTVRLGAQQATAQAGANGKWVVWIPAQAAGGPFVMTVTGSSTVTIHDVYVGEVWLASGQSNMDYRMHCTFGAPCALNNEAQEIANSNYPLIRSCNVPYAPSLTPVDTVSTQWLVSSPTTVANFSAAAYFFARELHNSLPNIAIGVIHASFGASTIQCWIPHDAIAAVPSAIVTQDLAAFDMAPNTSTQHNPYICYNGQIHALAPYAIRGVIWYQGESVTWGDNTYLDLQIAQIEAWRKAWGRDFTFLITQLAGYNGNGSGTWPLIREAQLQAAESVFNTGLAVTVDIGDATYVHPPDKQDVGLRLGLAARGITYAQSIPYSGPIYDHMAIEGSSIRIFFKHTETGLTFTGNVGTGFEIAGANNAYSSATAVIDATSSTVVVSSPAVPAPKNVRYAWAGFPMASLYNGGTPPLLPASPFRTDAPPLPPFVDGGLPDVGVPSEGGADATVDVGSATGAMPADDAMNRTPADVATDTAPDAVDGDAAIADEGTGNGSAPDATGGGLDATDLPDAGVSAGGQDGSGSTPSASPGATNAGGCSCHVATRHDDVPAAALSAGVLLIALRGARRRAERRGRQPHC